MSTDAFKLLNWAWAQNVSPPARKLVLLHLADRHNPKFGYSWPSIRETAERCGITPSQARRHIRALQDDGLLDVRLCRWESGANASNRYYLLMPTLAPVQGGTSIDATLPLHAREGGIATTGGGDSINARVSLASTQAKPPEEPIDEPVGKPTGLTLSDLLEGERAPARNGAHPDAAAFSPLRAREGGDDSAGPERVGTLVFAPPAPLSLSRGENHVYDTDGLRVPTAEEVRAAETNKASILAAAQRYMASRAQSPTGE